MSTSNILPGSLDTSTLNLACTPSRASRSPNPVANTGSAAAGCSSGGIEDGPGVWDALVMVTNGGGPGAGLRDRLAVGTAVMVGVIAGVIEMPLKAGNRGAGVRAGVGEGTGEGEG